MQLQAKILQEYRCPDCLKLLCKGVLNGMDSEVEVKCRVAAKFALSMAKTP